MKKLIARISNSIRDRRRLKREVTPEVDKVYLVTHALHAQRKVLITAVNDTWAEGVTFSTPERRMPESIILMRSLCKFTEVKK